VLQLVFGTGLSASGPLCCLILLAEKITAQACRPLFRSLFAYANSKRRTRWGFEMRMGCRTICSRIHGSQQLFYGRIHLSEAREIRDPIHGFIRLNEQESDLLDTAAFQRLRHLRQPALAYLVYPGAMHSRFEHSLGVCHVAGLLSSSLTLSGDERRLLRLAALLHDLGHGPFSHVSEEALELYADRSRLLGKTDKIHEVITATLIRQDEEISRLLSDSEREKIITLLDKGYGEPVVRAVL
jgi:HD domain